jgi:hypothetical protein
MRVDQNELLDVRTCDTGAEMTACCASLRISGSDVELLREKLGWVSECFELQCVATRIEKDSNHPPKFLHADAAVGFLGNGQWQVGGNPDWLVQPEGSL